MFIIKKYWDKYKPYLTLIFLDLLSTYRNFHLHNFLKYILK